MFFLPTEKLVLLPAYTADRRDIYADELYLDRDDCAFFYLCNRYRQRKCLGICSQSRGAIRNHFDYFFGRIHLSLDRRRKAHGKSRNYRCFIQIIKAHIRKVVPLLTAGYIPCRQSERQCLRQLFRLGKRRNPHGDSGRPASCFAKPQRCRYRRALQTDCTQHRLHSAHTGYRGRRPFLPWLQESI